MRGAASRSRRLGLAGRGVGNQLDIEQNMNKYRAAQEVMMLRRLSADAAELVALGLFMSMVAALAKLVVA